MSDKPKIDFSKLESLSRQQEAEWHLRNTPDLTVYGPYSQQQILTFAAEGRIALASELKNLVVTKGKWVSASRISAISKVIPKPVSPPQEPIEKENAFEFLQASKTIVKPRKESFFDLFDLSFKKYATPWVVRFIWLLFLVCWAINFAFVSYLFFGTTAIMTYLVFTGKSNNLFWTETLVFYSFYLVINFFILLTVRLVLEGCVALFDISNSLKEMNAKNAR